MTSPKIQKASFITIIVLLVLFVPITGYSIFLKITTAPIPLANQNTSHQMFYDGKLWFYSAAGEILGTYACEHTYCSYGVSYENDGSYALNYFNSEESSFLPIINDQFVFIHDSDDLEGHEVFLYDIKSEVAYKNMPYASIKNYQVGLENNLFIAENMDHQFGVLQITFMATPIIPYEYDFIGILADDTSDVPLNTDYFVVLSNSEWKIIDQNEAVLTSDIMEPIVTFNGEYIITKLDDVFHIMNYSGLPVMDEDFKYLSFTGRYLNCVNENDEFYLYDFVSESMLGSVHSLKSSDTVRTELKEDTIEIYINEKIVESVSLT